MHRRDWVDSCICRWLRLLQLQDLGVCLDFNRFGRHLTADESALGQFMARRIRFLGMRLKLEVGHLFLIITVILANFVLFQTISIIRATERILFLRLF